MQQQNLNLLSFRAILKTNTLDQLGYINNYRQLSLNNQ